MVDAYTSSDAVVYCIAALPHSMLAARSGTYKLFSGGWLSTINESSTKLSLLFLMYFACHEWKQIRTSTKV